MKSLNVRARAIFSGKRTQGIGLRKKVMDRATRLGLKGWVKNNTDGTVEAVFEGTKETIDEIIEWCKTKIENASIDNVEIIWEPHTGSMAGFEVLPTK